MIKILNDEHGIHQNRIEQAEQKIQKKMAKIKIDFLTFLGSAVLAGAVALFF
jgi:hypothetical protein